ncbi:hypothetical protein PAEPH01_1168 [Pancytospora epiphaga]|nr:hypothetical protein PAEPH01_1168 [Pancytospora epiphaga]
MCRHEVPSHDIMKEAGEIIPKAVENGVRTLIIGKEMRGVRLLPSFICKHKGTIFILETSEYLEGLTSAIDDYKTFIMIGFRLNNFEKEFLRQICDKLDKKVITVEPEKKLHKQMGGQSYLETK